MSRSCLPSGNGALRTSAAKSASAADASASVTARAVRWTRLGDPSAQRPAVTVSFQTPGRTWRFVPDPRDARILAGCRSAGDSPFSDR